MTVPRLLKCWEAKCSKRTQICSTCFVVAPSCKSVSANPPVNAVSQSGILDSMKHVVKVLCSKFQDEIAIMTCDSKHEVLELLALRFLNH